jgi:hypothetical protein
MNWLNKLERRFGFIAVPNAITYIIAGQVLATLFARQQPGLAAQMLLDPEAVSRGELWRLVTFVFVPQDPSGAPWTLIFTFMWFYFLWFMGRGLEHEWGAFKLTVYLASGLLCQIAVSLLAWFTLRLPIIQSGHYWTLSIQLAFAYLYPDFTIYILMVLPIKMRWWAWVIGAFMVLNIVNGGMETLVIVCAALGNYLLFFGPDYVAHFRMRRQTAGTRAKMQASVDKAMSTAPLKACVQCGAGAVTADIRLCTCERCGEEGKFWCTEHLPAHLGK